MSDRLRAGCSKTNVAFSVDKTAGKARSGELDIRNTTVETPVMLPVINFYAGGTKDTLYGGGIFRTVKEFMTGEIEPATGEVQSIFDGAMFSISSFADYGTTEDRLEDHLRVPIKERETFEPFDGLLFVDSGGYKFLHQGEKKKSYWEDMNQRRAFSIQQQLGADVVANLDHPLSPEDSYEARTDKMRETALNAREFLRVSSDFAGARYLTIHGFNYSMLNRFFDEIDRAFGTTDIEDAFDGIALGSLVGRKDSADSLIRAVTDCKQILAERGLNHLPLHLFGVGSSSVPLLASLGVDSFDSSTYLHTAANGHYSTSIVGKTPLEEAPIEDCGCPVCSTPELVSRMRGNAEYQKDILGPVAMHNLYVQKRETAKIRNNIQSGDPQSLIDYIDETVARSKRLRQAAHSVVNDALGGYF
jgi:tRNA-guanine family transglycosylase